MAFLWSTSNICLVNNEIHFHFKCRAIYLHKVWWPISNLIGDRIFCSWNHGILLHVTRPVFRAWVRDYYKSMVQSRVQVLQRPYHDCPAGHCNTIITLECRNWLNWSGQGLTTFGTNKSHNQKLWGHIYPVINKLMMHIKYLVITNQLWAVFCSWTFLFVKILYFL